MGVAAAPTLVQPKATGGRIGYIDNLKVILVAGVIVGHTTIAWTGIGNWVVEEPHVREPLLTIASMLMVSSLFAMALFFALAGMFTVPSLARKGLPRFLRDRTLRLGIPMAFFVIFLSPIVEYFDTDNLGWDEGFLRFVPEIWWPPAPGPTWFLGVLLVFSLAFAVVRTLRPIGTSQSHPLRPWNLVTTAALVAVATYAIRMVLPLGQEVWHLALSQAPGWVAGFTLGVLGAERGWFRPVAAPIARIARWTSLGAIVTSVAVLAVFTGPSLDLLAGGGSWQSALPAVLEGVLVAFVPFWIVDLFQRHFNHQGRLLRSMSRAAFAAFVIHQAVLVGLVLASRMTPWAPEVEYLAVSVLGVALSFSFGGLVLRVPGVSRIV